ncbi:MurR/RpiR family transcriptional regulator [Salinisphaera sp. LB1]|uniref:MurR/RpiR family transcriptional regulator n=1 Tax=Salinisphaera sp. LB1 TaxID=2183911 RepID=UPI000D70648F|nr:MurR/RpiR family transcriptional regulator [Salinisphaera sp. LB1]AWN17844.1 putative transcriptional regulator of the myo-inositol catabolic operon [Salinisphaera sp. LB1]
MTEQAPETPSELQRRILAEYKNLSKRLQQIAQFAVDHPNDMALETTAVIADRAGVQPSAIIRFAKAFGYSGFSELQRVYQTRLAETASSYSERLRRLRREEENDTQALTPHGVLRQFCQANRMALDHLADEIDAEGLASAARIMAGAECIHLCGHRRSFPVVTYMAYALSRIQANACLLDGLGGMLAQQTARVRPDDVLFAVSFHPYAEETAETIRHATEQGTPVVVLTDSPLSPVAAHATVCLEVHDAEMHNFRSLTASMCLAQALTVAVGLALDEQPDEHRS